MASSPIVTGLSIFGLGSSGFLMISQLLPSGPIGTLSKTIPLEDSQKIAECGGNIWNANYPSSDKDKKNDKQYDQKRYLNCRFPEDPKYK